MNNTLAIRGSRRALVLVALALILLGLALWSKTGDGWEQAYEEESLLRQFTAENVLGNRECRQHPGNGPSSDVAVVVLPSPEESIFASVDGTGVLNTGVVPFSPTRLAVARREDRSVLTMFGRKKWDEPEDSSQDFRLPVQIHLDGRAIFAHDNIWESGLAEDGSSFFVIEPVDESTSELVIHNLDAGGERRYALGDLFQSYDIEEMMRRWSDDEVTYQVRYSTDYEELIFHPMADGMGNHHFFSTSVDGGERRTIGVQFEDGITEAIFATSEVGFLSLGERFSSDPSFLVRREYSWSSGLAYQDHWRQNILEGRLFQLSSDGSHILIQGDEIQVLDTSNGEILLSVPNRYRIANSSGASHDSELGGVEQGIRFSDIATIFGGQLIVQRNSASLQESAESRLHEFYDLDNIRADAEPNRRVSININIQCEAGNSPVRGLQEQNGQLIFNP